MNIQDLKSKLAERLLKLKRAKKSAIPHATPSNAEGLEETGPAEPALPLAHIEVVEKHNYVFGLDWRFFTDRKDLSQTLSLAKKDGYTHRVITQTEDLVGIGRILETKKKGKLHSASLQLAQGVSLGGVEIFVFQLETDHFCLIALNESRAVIGYEKTGTRDEILTLAGEFQLAHVGHNIRQVGNTGALEHEEHVKLAEAFARPDDTTRINKIPNYKILFISSVVILGIILLIYSIYGYLNEAKSKAAAQKIAQEKDPNFLYEKSIDVVMQNVGLHAQIQLERWRSTIKDVPLSRQGWSLTGIECAPEECKLGWKRDFGSFADFFTVSQAGESKNTESQEANNPANSSIQTILKVSPASNDSRGLQREKLPTLTELQRPLASQLQDLSLLPKSTVALKVPELFSGSPGVAGPQILKPVVRGDWSIVHDIWSLNDLSFNIPAMVAESLTVSPVEKTSQWVYTLKGHYYAKGKDF